MGKNRLNVKTFYQFTVLETHLDTFGHINNATYLTLFEQARWEILENNNYGLKVIQESQKGPVILKIEIKYKKEVSLREQMTIETSYIKKVNPKVIRIQQQMLNGNKDLCCEAIFDIGFMDLQKRKLIHFSNEYINIFH